MSEADKPAFPCEITSVNPFQWSGLTKREYYAGLALQGVLAFSGLQDGFQTMAELSVKQADALLAELEKGK